jgi:hypothetical protein
MKHSKFALGASALLLAVAGAFATRANTKVGLNQYYTFNGTAVLSPCPNAGALICKDSQSNILYTAPTRAEDPTVLTVHRIN